MFAQMDERRARGQTVVEIAPGNRRFKDASQDSDRPKFESWSPGGSPMEVDVNPNPVKLDEISPDDKRFKDDSNDEDRPKFEAWKP